MIPQVDFDIADSILRVLEGWELGNDGLYWKYWSYIKQNFILILAALKSVFQKFPEKT